MNWLDYAIIIVYSFAFIGLGYFFKNNKSSKDYFLGGKSMGWFPLTLSTMATQLSAISFISAPAFVGLAAGGGFKWLTFELSVPLAMIFIMLVIVPPLYRSGIVSIYEYVENRFATSTRMILSIVFQISRALGTGVMVYTIAIILQAVLDVSFHWTILIISIITLIYSFQGGMKAVIWGDTIQMIILFGGLIICLFYGWELVQSNGGLANGFDPERLKAIDFSKMGFRGDEFGFWPMVIGGFFLYASYYGCDQTQAQRLLSAKNENTIRTLLLANGVLRFPIVMVYCTMGLFIGALVTLAPDFLTSIADMTQKHFPQEFAEAGLKPDLMIPVFIVKYLPHGLIGILIIGILSAAMSTLSSTINSLSAVSMEDIFNRGKKRTRLSNEKYMKYSKSFVLFWGVICITAAYLFGGSESTVIEIINLIGSLFYGPILATFVLAILSKRVNYVGMNAGIIVALAINLLIKTSFDNIFWIWYNFTGMIIAVVVAYVVSIIFESRVKQKEKTNLKLDFKWSDLQKKEVLILGVFFVFIVTLCVDLPEIFGRIF
ncbi:MAG: sodium/solute symporter [Bacteroidales bacterium]|nr:sodium/solute symporter [Bacteroidales bacterium]